ncbi:MAG: class I SAM-dependent methyltransferase [Burkholderiales bacterium]|nr:class I SAM-dependent methyltransferase [Burkholderiales bacterium]
MAPTDSDLWSDWLLRRRQAGDADYRRQVQAEVAAIAERVIDGARLAPGMTLADVGSGEGVVVWRAFERVGPTLAAIVTDISQPLLDHAREQARERGVLDRCRFLADSAERLDGIADASVDALTMRAVLAYVGDKAAAMREAWRVLKPGGRLSIAEPILRGEALKAAALRRLVEAQPPGARDRFMELMLRWKSAQFPATDEAIAASPLAGHDERDLLRLAQRAGFAPLHLELHIDVRPSKVPNWQVFLGVAPHPWAPSLGELFEREFDADERMLLEQVLRPTIDSGQGLSEDPIAYLQAVKPAA